MSLLLPPVIRAAEMEALGDAVAIRARAGKEAAAVLAEARAEGRAQGAAQGIAEAAGLLAATAAALDAFWRDKQDELVSLALAAAVRVAGALPPPELAAGLVRTVLAEYRQDTSLQLRACPEDAARLRAALQEVGPDAAVTVRDDPGLAPGACVLDHAGGRTNLGVLDQFRAMLSQAEAG